MKSLQLLPSFLTSVSLLLCGASVGAQTSARVSTEYSPTAPISATPTPVAPVASTSIAQNVAHAANLSAHVLWIDATANIDTTANVNGIEALMERAKQAHINTVVFDAKPLSGEVLYASQIAPRLSQWKGKKYDPNFDRLAAVIAAARKRNMSIYAAMNTFSEGHKYFNAGPGYAKPEWQSVSYNVERSVQAADGATLNFPSTADEAAPLGQLSVLNSPAAVKSTFKPDGISAVLDASGKIVLIGEAPVVARTEIPAGGKVLTGARAARDWIQAHLRVGDSVKFNATPLFKRTAEAPWEKVGVFVSPHRPEVRDYERSIAREIATKYDVDGVVFDRMRFANITTDFSDVARVAFEKRIGRAVANWPQDIMSYSADPAAPRIEGPLWKEWLEFRAATIRDFLAEATAEIRAVKPQTKFAVYVGSWYSDYAGVGVNWASDDFNAAYDWMTPEYYKTGYAQHLDWLTTGCYFPIATREEALAKGADPNATVESAAILSNQVANDVAFVYGGLYLEDYRNNPDAFMRSVRAAKSGSQGAMIFDAVHLDMFGWWDELRDALGSDAVAPHQVPGLRSAVRATSSAIKSLRPGPTTTAPKSSIMVPVTQRP